MMIEQEAQSSETSKQAAGVQQARKPTDCPENQIIGLQVDNGECWNMFCRVTKETIFPAQYGDQTIYFCKDCVKLYEIKNCCYFCAQVYSNDEQNFLDGKKWLQCDTLKCNKWMHVDCEAKLGIPNIQYLMKNKIYKYKCPWCRLQQQTRKQKMSKKIFEKQDNNHHKLHENLVNLDETINEFQEIIETKQTLKIIKPYSQPLKLSILQKHVFNPIMIKNQFLEELLKKYGNSHSPYVSQEDTISDLVKIKSLIK